MSLTESLDTSDTSSLYRTSFRILMLRISRIADSSTLTPPKGRAGHPFTVHHRQSYWVWKNRARSNIIWSGACFFYLTPRLQRYIQFMRMYIKALQIGLPFIVSCLVWKVVCLCSSCVQPKARYFWDGPWRNLVQWHMLTQGGMLLKIAWIRPLFRRFPI